MTASRHIRHQTAPSQNNPARNNAGQVPFQRSRARPNSNLHSQADTRHPILTYDQHGRQWSCQVENRSGQPTGLITNDFSAPWLPDQSYLIINPENTSELWINYRLMGLERKTALRGYHELAVALTAEKGWPLPKKLGEYSADVRRVLGRPPQPLEPVRAAIAENPWIMGFSDDVDPRLVEFVAPPDEFIMDFEDDVDFSAEGYEDALGPTADPDAPAARVDGNQAVPAPSAAGVARFRAQAQPAVLDDLDDFSDLDDGEDAEDAEDAQDYRDAGEHAPTQGIPTGDGAADLLEELEQAADPAHLGGRTVAAPALDRAERQAPRREGSTAPPRKQAISRGGRSRQLPSLRERQATAVSEAAARAAGGAAPPARAPSLADGARPNVSAAGLATEHQRPMPE